MLRPATYEPGIKVRRLENWHRKLSQRKQLRQSSHILLCSSSSLRTCPAILPLVNGRNLRCTPSGRSWTSPRDNMDWEHGGRKAGFI